ncbi:MAG: Ig-like domain-containing protein [Gemmatimonadales bacterium]
MRAAHRLLLAFPIAGLGCPSEPSRPAVASVTVTLGVNQLTVGQTTQATATARSATNEPIAGVTVSWRSSAAGIATVSETGLVTAAAAGSTSIVATIEGLDGSAGLEVFAGPPNLALTNLHLTQSVQRLDGGLPLVAGGLPALLNLFGTLDRAFPTSSPAPQVRIEVWNGATLVLTDEAPMNGTALPVVNSGVPIHRVVVPANLIQPGFRVRATINPGNQPAEATSADNTWPPSGLPQPMLVQQVPPLPLHLVPIFLTAAGTTGNVSPETQPEYFTATRQMHPVSTIEADIGPVFSSDVDFGNGNEPAWLALLQQLDLLRVAEGASSYYIGAVRPPPGITFVQFGGYGYIPGDPQSTGPNTRTSVLVGVGWFNRARQTTELVAHELGHNMGRRHAPCGGAAFPDPGYPYPGGVTGLLGFDLYTWSQNPSGFPVSYPATSGDLMSYCTPPWISDYTYLGLLAARGGPVATPRPLAPGPWTPACDCLVIWGSVEGDSIRLEPAFLAPAPAGPAVPSSGAYAVEGLDLSGNRLFLARFDPVEIDHAPGVRHFTLAIPLGPGGGTALSLLRVRGPGVLAERRASERRAAEPPSLDVQQTPSDRLTLRWNPAEFPLLVARQAGTGRIIGIGRSGTLSIGAAAVEVTLSNGIRSSQLRVHPR